MDIDKSCQHETSLIKSQIGFLITLRILKLQSEFFISNLWKIQTFQAKLKYNNMFCFVIISSCTEIGGIKRSENRKIQLALKCPRSY